MTIEPIEYKKECDGWKQQPIENTRIRVEVKHFEVFSIDDEMIEYAVGFPRNWNQ